MTKQPNTLTVDEAAAALGLSRTWAYAHLRAGTIRSTRIGRFYRVERAEVDRLLKQGLPPLGGTGTGKRKASKAEMSARRRASSPLD